MITITVKVDPVYEIADVCDGQGMSLYGSFSDFHNDFWGLHYLPKFNTHDELASVLKSMYEDKGEEAEIIISTYVYTG